MGERLTKDDVRKIQEEIEHRKLVVRQACLEDLKEARSHGDLSENFEYYAAKRERGKNEGRIRYLERVLKFAEIVEDELADDEIGLNNTVKVLFIEDDEEETYKIVTSIRQDTLKNMVSIESPVGKALMGHKAGETVTVQVSGNVSYELKILEVTKTTDEAEDAIRGF